MTTRPARIVALGGGHGLFAALSAARRLDVDLTAVVTVADDGGSSGRIRRQFGSLPPGDLRMALAALAGPRPQDRVWADLYQHRLGGTGALAGHPVGNLVLTGLLELQTDPVAALKIVSDSLGAVGRVLPMSEVPLDLIATVETLDRDDPVRSRRIRGQAAIASALGRVSAIELQPADAPACAQAVAAVADADLVLLGPGSWFTSVIPHLLLAELARALVETRAQVVVALNLVPQPGETDGFTPADHLRALRRYCPRLPVAAVIADRQLSDGDVDLAATVEALAARLITGELRTRGRDDQHDPAALAAAISCLLPARSDPAADLARPVDRWHDIGR